MERRRGRQDGTLGRMLIKRPARSGLCTDFSLSRAQLYHATCHAEAALSRSNAAASVAASRTSVRTSRESTPTSLAGSRKRKAGSVDPLGNATSPLKPPVERAPDQDGQTSKTAASEPADAAAAGVGVDGSGEPDAKRVKAEPQEAMPLFRTDAEE